MADIPRLLKVTRPDGSPMHGGSGAWPLPKTDRLGRLHKGPWREVRGELGMCSRGLHLTDEAHLGEWVGGDCVVWEAEADPAWDMIRGDDKWCVGRARLLRRVAAVTKDDLDAFREEYQFRYAPRTLADVMLAIDAGQTRARRRAEDARRKAEEAMARAATEAIEAAKLGLPLVFGVHRLPAKQAYCEAWPAPAALEGRLRRQADARARRALGVTAAEERLAARIAKARAEGVLA